MLYISNIFIIVQTFRLTHIIGTIGNKWLALARSVREFTHAIPEKLTNPAMMYLYIYILYIYIYIHMFKELSLLEMIISLSGFQFQLYHQMLFQKNK